MLSEAPLIFAIDDFASPGECASLQQLMLDSRQHLASATAPAQEALRTSTTAFPNEQDVAWLRERIARATNVSIAQLEPTKLTHYAPGQFFKKHTDASFLNEKMWAFAARLAGVDEDGVQDPCSWPGRCCTLFLYCNSVSQGGRTRFRWLDGSASMPGSGIFSGCIAALDGGTSAARSPAADELSIVPRAGLAIIHFPCTKLEHGCVPDPRTMHESEPAGDDKFIVQQFIWPVPIAGSDDCSSSPCSHTNLSTGQWHDDVRAEWTAIHQASSTQRPIVPERW